MLLWVIALSYQHPIYHVNDFIRHWFYHSERIDITFIYNIKGHGIYLIHHILPWQFLCCSSNNLRSSAGRPNKTYFLLCIISKSHHKCRVISFKASSNCFYNLFHLYRYTGKKPESVTYSRSFIKIQLIADRILVPKQKGITLVASYAPL